MPPIKRKEKRISVPQNVSQLRDILPSAWTATWTRVGLKPGFNHAMSVRRKISTKRFQAATFYGPTKLAVTFYAYTWLAALGELMGAYAPPVKKRKQPRKR